MYKRFEIFIFKELVIINVNNNSKNPFIKNSFSILIKIDLDKIPKIFCLQLILSK